MATPDSARAPGAVAYVVMGFPRLSETFISNEILLLESLGTKLRVYAVKHGDEDRMHASVASLRSPVEYLPRATSLSGTPLTRWLRENLPRYRAAHAAVFRRRPLAWLATAASALAMCVRYRRERFGGIRKVFLKEFLQAGAIAERVLEAGDVSQLHGHFCHGATTITWFASRLTGLPFSFTAHAKDIYQADQNPGDLLARKIRAARFVATCTDANRQHLVARFPEGAGIYTIYHGLDTEFFAPRPRAVADEPPLVLAVGRFVEKKGLAYLVAACAQLHAAGAKFRCLLVGEDGGELPKIRAAIAAHGLAEVVTIQGPVTHDELRELYARASLFTLPCLVAADGDRDGIPNVLAEAMAMALPVVTTAVSGIPEIVTDGHDGLVVPERDADALAHAIGGLLADPARRATLGAAARATICRQFDSRRTTVALRSLLAAHGAGCSAHGGHAHAHDDDPDPVHEPPPVAVTTAVTTQ